MMYNINAFRFFAWSLSLVSASSVLGQRDTTGVRLPDDGAVLPIPISHTPLVASDGSEPIWLFYELPMEEAAYVSPEGWVLGETSTQVVRWKPGELVENLLATSGRVHVKYVMNSLGDVVTSSTDGSGPNPTEVYYHPLAGASRSVSTGTYSSEIYALDDLGFLWAQVFPSTGNHKIIGMPLYGHGRERIAFKASSIQYHVQYTPKGFSANGHFFLEYEKYRQKDGGYGTRATYNWNGVDCGFYDGGLSGFRVVSVNSWGAALASDGVHLPDGSIEPLPSMYMSYGIPSGTIDEYGYIRGEALDTELQYPQNVPFYWKPIRTDGGELQGYSRRRYIDLPLPEGWESEVKMIAEEKLPQIGIAAKDGRTSPFLLLPVRADLDVDSDNDGQLLRSKVEEESEAPDPLIPDASKPGKVLFVNNGDTDSDGVPDFADGLNLFTDDGVRQSVESQKFTPMVLELPDLNDLRVVFNYDASDPAGVLRTGDSSSGFIYEPAPGQLRIWIKDGDQLRLVEPIGSTLGDFVQTNVQYTRDDLGFVDGEKTKTLYIESVRPSSDVASDRVKMAVWFEVPADSSVEPDYADEVAFTSLNVRMVPDYDRNGIIDHNDHRKLDRGSPFFFWINDDDDTPGSETGGDDIPDQGEDADAMRGERTYNSKVDGTRDLIDFFPVYMDLERLLQVFDPNEVSIRLYGIDANFLEIQAANPFGWGFGPNTVGTYLSLPERSQWFARASVLPVYETVDSRSPYLSRDFIQQASNGNGTLLLEGVAPISGGRLRAQLLYQNKVIHEVTMPINLSKIEDMFRHVNLTNRGFGENETSTRYATSSGGPPGYPDSVTNKKNFVFVHGYNVNNQGARGTFSEVFKRLYWSGSNARFIAVSWHGFSSKSSTLGVFTPDYHENVINALETASYFKSAIGDELDSLLGGGETVVCAHSLGNILVSQAIVEHGYDPDYYYMVNAAVALEAYNGFRSAQYGSESLVEPKWREYSSKDLYASNWSKLFEESADDPRRDYKWTGFFSGIEQGFNFYSSGEEVLESNRDGAKPPLINLETFKGRFSWTLQEMVKGTVLAQLTTLDISAGWGFNQSGLYEDGGWSVASTIYDPFSGLWVPFNAPMDQMELDELELASDQLMQRLRITPFFRNFQPSDSDPQFVDYDGNDLMTEIDSPQALQTASIDIVKHKVLAEGIPALSYPVGSNEILVFDNLDVGRNVDMNQSFQIDWPEERDDLIANGVNYRWRHSDFVDVAYSYVYRLYDRWVLTAKLDEE